MGVVLGRTGQGICLYRGVHPRSGAYSGLGALNDARAATSLQTCSGLQIVLAVAKCCNSLGICAVTCVYPTSRCARLFVSGRSAVAWICFEVAGVCFHCGVAADFYWTAAK